MLVCWVVFPFFRHDVCDDIAHQRNPSLRLGQLWRSCPNGVQAFLDIGNHGFDLVLGFMHQGQQQPGLSGMLRQSGDAGVLISTEI